jgi:lipopolysaccharide exporter
MTATSKRINAGWVWVRNIGTSDPIIVVGTMIALNLLRIISSLLLTRLLSPADFGIVGMVAVAQYTVIMLLDFGTDTYLVRHREIHDRRQLDVIWTIRFLRLIFVAGITALAAGVFSHILGNESLTVVLAVSSLATLASAPQSLSFSLAARSKQIVLLGAIDVGMAVFNLFLTIAMAIWLRNYWAIIISSIIGASMRSLLSYLLFPSQFYRFAFDPEIAAKMWKFSRYVIGSSVITLILSQVDKFVLGHFLTIGEFGIYLLAASLAIVPKMFCETYGSRVLFPTYAQAYRDDRSSIREVFHAKLWLVGPLYCFAVGSLISLAPVVVAVMYQDRYADAAYYLALLSIPSFFALSSIAATEALIAVGEVRATFHANLVRLGWLIPSTSVAVCLGRPAGILVALAFSELPATLYTWWRLRRKGILSLRREVPTFLIGGLGVVTGWLVYRAVEFVFHIVPVGLFP